MLIKAADGYFIRNDPYCLMVCKDKGLTKFPKGVEANYYQPLRFPSHFYQSSYSLAQLDITDLDEEFVKACRADYEIRRWLESFKIPRVEKDFDFLGCSITCGRDYKIKFRSKESYHIQMTNVLWSCYEYSLRHSEFNTAQELIDFIDEFVNLVKKHCDAVRCECPEIQRGDYPPHLNLQ